MVVVSVEQMRQTFDPATIARGRAYVAEGRVLKTSAGTGRGQTVVMGEVRGSGRHPYVATVTVTDVGAIRDTRCSCPVTYECKHCVAVLLAEQARSTEPTPAAVSGWVKDLAGLLGDLDQQPTGSVAWVPLALEVEYHPRESRWGGQAFTLPIRPMKRGRRDNWIKTGVSWRDAEYGMRYQREYRPAQVEVLADMATTFVQGYSNQNPDLLSLGPMVWPLLRRAQQAGIELLPGPGLTSITLDSDAATVQADVSRDDTEMAVRIGVQVDGRWWPNDEGELATIGDKAHGLALLRRAEDAGRYPRPTRELTLVPLAQPLPASLQRRLPVRTPIVVPAAARDQFEVEFLPRLRRHLSVGSSDGTYEVPTVAPPRLVCTLEWAATASVRTSWTWRYAQGRHVQTYVLDSLPSTTDNRDLDAERAILDALTAPDGMAGWGARSWTDADLVRFVADVLPELRAAAESGAYVLDEVGEPRDYRAAIRAPDVTFGASEAKDDRDWLDLSVAISVDGESVPLGSVLTALTTGQEFIFTEAGRHVPARHPAFARLADLVADAAQLVDQPGDGLRVSRHDLSMWAELEALGVVDDQASQWARNARALMHFDGLPDVLLEGLAAEPRPYQVDGIRWLTYLWKAGLGGILADDMGLGKTLQTLALIDHARRTGAGPFLVVAPTSVIGTWVSETARHTPGLVARPVTATVAGRGQTLAEAYAGADIVVTSYTLFRLRAQEYRDLSWGGLILDEAHTVKNHQGKTYNEIRQLDVPFRLALTGTPFENRLLELWSLLSIVAPGLYPHPKRFTEYVVRPVEQGGDDQALARFRRRVRPFLLRRTKDLVAADLPPKQEQVLSIELSPKHRRIYDTHLQRERQTVLGLVDDFNRNRIAIFSALTRLRQLSLDPALVDAEHEGVGSAKLDALVDQVAELASEGHRALVFSQFTTYLRRVQRRLEAEGIDTVYLDGRTRDRPRVIEEFKSGTQPVFLISLKAGGSGLTLTEADYVFILDPWWNPAVEAQAIDRTHRIGQTQHVMAYRMVSVGTIEEKVMALKERKAALFAKVLDGESGMSAELGAADVRALFDDPV
ncbi:DNA helicase [Nocardioides baekrokdamisoli]|uniref:DNA helicase n=1 Tax=Nocardioides baekrokdamisoli TaxID=1804624 RepID=A0A3G9J3G1_9ACTN|nr:DEAD/DEAH box helicase [Nocardioides baekrokdamisoli]BBH18168.1 DNA helicase [Nocardioides baekrokdamisoli]